MTEFKKLSWVGHLGEQRLKVDSQGGVLNDTHPKLNEIHVLGPTEPSSINAFVRLLNGPDIDKFIELGVADHQRPSPRTVDNFK